MKPDRFEQARTITLMLIVASIPLKKVIINSILVLVLAALVVAESIYRRQFRLSSWKSMLILSGFFFLTVLAVLYSEDTRAAMAKVETRLSLAAFPVLFLLTRPLPITSINKILWTFVASCLVVSVVCIVSIFYDNYSAGITFSNATAWYFSADYLTDKYGFHPSYFSIYFSFCLCILFYFYKHHKISLVMLLLVACYIVVFLLLLASRVGLGAFALICALTIIYEAYIRKKLLLGLAIMAGFFGLMLALVFSSQIPRDKFNAMLGRNVTEYNKTYMMTKRFEQWASAVEIYKAHPAVGVGPGDLQEYLQVIYARRGFQEGVENRYNPHNLFLDTAAALGTVGLIAIFILFGAGFYRAVVTRNLLWFQMLFLFLMISFVESSLSVQKGIVFFACFNTLFFVSGLGVNTGNGSTTPTQ